MTDREMLELAARAAGFIDIATVLAHKRDESETDHWVVMAIDPAGQKVFWSSLDCDSDALQLAAALKIDLDWQSTKGMPEPTVEAYRSSDDGSPFFCATEPEADYRRAITRAAAEIGKAMP